MLAVLLLIPIASSAGGRVVAADVMCDAAAKKAAAKWAVPEQILLAITRVETGRSNGHGPEPWPWTINVAGKGYWFESPEQAVAFAENSMAGGDLSVDVGCFQINMEWHGKAFDALEDAFDPQKNADYAAEFLSKLYRQIGSWRAAAAAYHSKTPDHAEAYVVKLEKALRDMLKTLPDAAEPAKFVPEKPNRFPLLKGGSGSGRGSLVPLGQMNGPLIGGDP